MPSSTDSSTTTVAAPAASAAPAPRTVLLHDARTRATGLVAAVALLLLMCAASLAVGSLNIPLHDVWNALTRPDDSDATAIVRDLRVPRTVLGLLVGAALGAAGALMQGVTRNPLAEPGLLGINAGAAFFVVVAISRLGVESVGGYVGFALAGAGLTAVAVFALGGTSRSGPTPIRLALAGAVLMTLLISLTSSILVFEARTLDEYRFWIVGSIAGRPAEVTTSLAPLFVLGLVLAVGSARGLNALALGDDVARSLGADVGRARIVAGVAFVILAGAAVAAAGPIAFVGLAVPHVARMLVGPDYRWIVPFSIVVGAILLLAGDTAGRMVARPSELQVGIITAFLGAPFFLWIVRRRRLVTL